MPFFAYFWTAIFCGFRSDRLSLFALSVSCAHFVCFIAVGRLKNKPCQPKGESQVCLVIVFIYRC